MFFRFFVFVVLLFIKGFFAAALLEEMLINAVMRRAKKLKGFFALTISLSIECFIANGKAAGAKKSKKPLTFCSKFILEISCVVLCCVVLCCVVLCCVVLCCVVLCCVVLCCVVLCCVV
ncbi:MAG: hypothetical protein LBQ37_04965, partial [Elusimicrobiota bacterium]|nr:hypothetical protein [Elusimicrobiota bacterium]